MVSRSRPNTCWAYFVANGRPVRRVGDHHAALEDARADADEGEPVAVGGVHAGLHLEHEGAERVGRARAAPPSASGAPRRGREVDQGVEQRADAEVETAEANSTGVVTPARNSAWSWSAPVAASSVDLLDRLLPGLALALGGGVGRAASPPGAIVAPPAVRVNRR